MNLKWLTTTWECVDSSIIWGEGCRRRIVHAGLVVRRLRACDVLTVRCAIFKGPSNTVKLRKRKRHFKRNKKEHTTAAWCDLYLVAVELKISEPVPIAFDGRHRAGGSTSTHTVKNCHHRFYGFRSSKNSYENIVCVFILFDPPYQLLCEHADGTHRHDEFKTRWSLSSFFLVRKYSRDLLCLWSSWRYFLLNTQRPPVVESNKCIHSVAAQFWRIRTLLEYFPFLFYT